MTWPAIDAILRALSALQADAAAFAAGVHAALDRAIAQDDE